MYAHHFTLIFSRRIFFGVSKMSHRFIWKFLMGMLVPLSVGLEYIAVHACGHLAASCRTDAGPMPALVACRKELAD